MTGCTASQHHGEGCSRWTHMGTRTHMHPCEQLAHMAWRKAWQLFQTIAFNTERCWSGFRGLSDHSQFVACAIHGYFCCYFDTIDTIQTQISISESQ